MFGESESESPRAGSPWDTLLECSTSPSPSVESEISRRAGYGIPRLVPEVEQGNVEYKLKLINPSPERFARLVTQLKWRLLEGGGQAYYELGVSDSGQLVGLPRAHLEQSLQTLEEMAGEIGASVIIVKEIDVPPALRTAVAAVPRRAPHGAVRMQRRRPTASEGESSAATEADAETELSTPDADDVGLDLQIDRALRRAAPETSTSFPLRSHPDRPASQSSPLLLPLDTDVDADADADAESDPPEIFSIDLEIASVYKPRPIRKRHVLSTYSTARYASAGPVKPPQTSGVGSKTKPRSQDSDATARTKKQYPHHTPVDPAVKAENKRDARNRRRAEYERKGKINLLLAGLLDVEPAAFVEVADKADGEQPQTDAKIVQDIAAMVPDLEALHVSLDKNVSNTGPTIPIPDSAILDVDAGASDAEDRRLIVEALVVRKMSLEEAFLDFGGFALEL